jgi:ATP-binding cassette, subfamily B, bacterial
MSMGPGMGGHGGGGRMRFAEESDVKTKITMPAIKRITAYFIPYWKQLLVSLLLLLAASLLGLAPPMLVGSIVDKALPQKDMSLLALLVGLSIGATLLLELSSVGQNYINTWISKHIIRNMKNQMYSHLQHFPMHFFATSKPGEIITRITSDVEGIQGIYNNTVVSFLRSILILATTAAALFVMNWKLAILGMILLPLFIIPTRRVGKFRWKIAQESQKKLGELNQQIQETLGISGSILMKIFTREPAEYRSFQKTNQEVVDLQIRESLAGRWFFMTMGVFTAIGPMLIYLYGGYLFIHGSMTVGGIIAFVALLSRLYGPVAQLSSIHIDVTRSMALFERIFEYFDMKAEEPDKPDAIELMDCKGAIEFKDVSFSYQDNMEVLHEISFRAQPGSMTALVGASGVGKTTVTNLIPRLYEIGGGSIRLDGTDIRDIRRESLRRHIGLVMQEPYLFNDTIEANLRYGKSDATDDEMAEACKAAHIHDFIMMQPNRYRTVVGNRGIKLSGGEKQRVSIARVILKDPGILILDEATSSLDSLSEMYIQKAMVPLLKGRTSIVIAHRLSTILAADNILVLDKGSIVESGTHHELLERGGLYTTLYNTQFQREAI